MCLFSKVSIVSSSPGSMAPLALGKWLDFQLKQGFLGILKPSYLLGMQRGNNEA